MQNLCRVFGILLCFLVAFSFLCFSLLGSLRFHLTFLCRVNCLLRPRRFLLYRSLFGDGLCCDSPLLSHSEACCGMLPLQL